MVDQEICSRRTLYHPASMSSFPHFRFDELHYNRVSQTFVRPLCPRSEPSRGSTSNPFRACWRRLSRSSNTMTVTELAPRGGLPEMASRARRPRRSAGNVVRPFRRDARSASTANPRACAPVSISSIRGLRCGKLVRNEIREHSCIKLLPPPRNRTRFPLATGTISPILVMALTTRC